MFGFAGVLGAVSYGVLTVLLLYSLVVWFWSVEWFTYIWADELTRYSNDRNKGGLGMSEYSRIPATPKPVSSVGHGALRLRCKHSHFHRRLGLRDSNLGIEQNKGGKIGD